MAREVIPDVDVSDVVLSDVVLARFASPSPDPVVAAVVRVLARDLRNDHVAMDLDDARTRDALSREVSRDDLDTDEVLAALALESRLCQFAGFDEEITADGPPLVVVDRRLLYLRRLAAAELRVAGALADARATRVALPRGLDGDRLAVSGGRMVEELARAGTPSPDLLEIATRCLTRRVSFITGGPGTGKTWIVAQILRLLDRLLVDGDVHHVTFVVGAPTGKAARRVAESIDRGVGDDSFIRLVRDRDREGSLHHLLGLHPLAPGRVNELHHDVVVVDEVSMADLPMIDILLRAAGDGTRVILVGDPHQLASVNVGAVLADVVNEEAGDEALISHLREVHRTDLVPILDLAAAVNDGDAARVALALEAGGEIIERRTHWDDPDLIATVMRHAMEVGDLARRGDGPAALAALRRLTVLCANREGPGSVAWWNALIGARYRARHPVAGGERFSVGEPVLVTRNQRALGVSNGDLGVVIERAGRRYVHFDDDRELPVGGVGHLESAWAMTIHKSQGSEFAHVIVVLAGEESPLLTRELLYTGVTRAGERVTLVGTPEVVARAVTTAVTRVSGLTHRLARWPVGVAGAASAVHQG